jgi:hypothetical protein
MHGCHNVLHNVLLAGERQMLCEKGVPALEAQRICSSGLQEAEDWDPDVMTKKSIAQSLRYFRLDGFDQLLVKLDSYLSNNVCLAIHVAMTDMKAMVNVVYTPLPTAEDIARFKVLADDLRARLAYLRAPTTIWGHVLSVHTPQFLSRWRTLYPFVCRGVEGKPRVFKADLQLSAGNQWRNGGFGFRQTLVLDRIRWQLYAEGSTRMKRKPVCRDTEHTVAYRAYETHMKNLVCV